MNAVKALRNFGHRIVGHLMQFKPVDSPTNLRLISEEDSACSQFEVEFIPNITTAHNLCLINHIKHCLETSPGFKLAGVLPRLHPDLPVISEFPNSGMLSTIRIYALSLI